MDVDELSCPNCSISVPKIPSRKTKCKSCNAYYYYAAKPGTGKKYIVSQRQKDEWDIINYLHKTINSLSYYNIKLDSKDELSDLSLGKLKHEAMRMLESCLHTNKNNYSVQAFVYHKMGKIARLFNDDPSVFDQFKLKSQLFDLQFSGIMVNAEIQSGGGSKCKNCKHLNGKVLSIEEAFNKKLLPHKDCSLTYCNASYIGKRDPNDPTLNLDVTYSYTVNINSMIIDNKLSFDLSDNTELIYRERNPSETNGIDNKTNLKKGYLKTYISKLLK